MSRMHTHARPTRRAHLIRLLLPFLVILGLISPLPVQAQGQQEIYVPLIASPFTTGPEQATYVPGQYIVVLNEASAGEVAPAAVSVADQADALAAQFGGHVLLTYESALRGFAATFPPEVIPLLEAHPSVAYVEQDQVIQLAETQFDATWGLDRIDQRDLPLDETYTYDVDGSGVHAYIIDTGIRSTHTEFTGRIGNGAFFVFDGRGTEDCNGHGTHVAGTVGGTTYGVAKGVTLHPVRVLNCGGGGFLSSVIAGVNWVTANHISPAVANMSLGGAPVRALDDAVRNSIAAGVTYVLAAGNEAQNACFSSPARTREAITVGATTSVDGRAIFSNFGMCLDIFAPGQEITSAWIGSDNDTNTISGTSMAAPHVTGAAALILDIAPDATPEEVALALIFTASLGRVNNPGFWSPNRLLYTGLFVEQ